MTAAAIAFAIVVAGFMTVSGNWIAQKIYPTHESDTDERRLIYGMLARSIGTGSFLAFAGLFYLAIRLGVIA